MCENRRRLDSPARMPDLRRRALLRCVEKQTRRRAFPSDASSRHFFRAARRRMAVLLQGQFFYGVLGFKNSLKKLLSRRF